MIGLYFVSDDEPSNSNTASKDSHQIIDEAVKVNIIDCELIARAWNYIFDEARSFLLCILKAHAALDRSCWCLNSVCNHLL